MTLCDPTDSSRPGSFVQGIFFRQEHWSALPFPSLGDLPDPGIEHTSPESPILQVDSLPTEPLGKPKISIEKQYCTLKKEPLGVQRILESGHICKIYNLKTSLRALPKSERVPHALSLHHKGGGEVWPPGLPALAAGCWCWAGAGWGPSPGGRVLSYSRRSGLPHSRSEPTHFTCSDQHWWRGEDLQEGWSRCIPGKRQVSIHSHPLKSCLPAFTCSSLCELPWTPPAQWALCSTSLPPTPGLP